MNLFANIHRKRHFYYKRKVQTTLGGYSDLNRELTVPHTVVLPIELYLPFFYI